MPCAHNICNICLCANICLWNAYNEYTLMERIFFGFTVELSTDDSMLQISVSASDAAICLIKSVNASERAFVDADSHLFQQTYCQRPYRTPIVNIEIFMKTPQDASCAPYRPIWSLPFWLHDDWKSTGGSHDPQTCQGWVRRYNWIALEFTRSRLEHL